MSNEAILVTGASGYIGSHVIKILLEEGYRVKGTVRLVENSPKAEALKGLVPDATYPLELVAADLTKDDGWKEAMEGCSSVIHMASPFPNFGDRTVKEEDIVVPAKEGTMRVLKAVVSAKIKKVVLTSSIVSIFAESDPKESVYTEENWSDPESPTIDVYSKSKVLAEKVAWDYLKELPDDEKFDLSVINPSFVLGPVLLDCQKDATSVAFMANILNKKYPAVPNLALNVCDVRDVAQAHVKALTVPGAVGNRHIIWTINMWMSEIATVAAKVFSPQGYSIATGTMPYFICWMVSFFDRQMKSYILPRLGKSFVFSNDRMRNVLGVTPTVEGNTIIDMCYSLVDIGIVRKAKLFKEVGDRTEPDPEEEKEQAREEKKEQKEEEKQEEVKQEESTQQ